MVYIDDMPTSEPKPQSFLDGIHNAIKEFSEKLGIPTAWTVTGIVIVVVLIIILLLLPTGNRESQIDRDARLFREARSF
jgi:hypothetical protein